MENIVSDGIQVLVPPDAGLREGARPGWDEGPYAFMRRVLSSDAGHELYKHRKAKVEPVCAQNKFNRGFRRFQRRGRAAVRSEWRLQAAVHNLLKLHSHGIDPGHHLTGLSELPRPDQSGKSQLICPAAEPLPDSHGETQVASLVGGLTRLHLRTGMPGAELVAPSAPEASTV